jgi:hypothetical protein
LSGTWPPPLPHFAFSEACSGSLLQADKHATSATEVKQSKSSKLACCKLAAGSRCKLGTGIRSQTPPTILSPEKRASAATELQQSMQQLQQRCNRASPATRFFHACLHAICTPELQQSMQQLQQSCTRAAPALQNLLGLSYTCSLRPERQKACSSVAPLLQLLHAFHLQNLLGVSYTTVVA